MIKKINFLILCVLVFSILLPAQETNSVSESRKKNIMKQLDYRFKGGYYTFEKIFNNNVTYPEMLERSCIMGIVIVSFEVDCNGEFVEFSFKNPIHELINKEITDFFDLTFDLWNECKDEKYTRFEIPIQFRIKDVETNTTDAILVCEGESLGYVCNGDDYYYKKANKHLEKGKGKKAMEYIEMLIKHDPYNLEYYDMKKEALSKMK
jgi:hypothetical protein